MGTTKRAEELAKELSERLEGLCEGLAISGDSPSKETILNYFNELNNYRQSEIDELTKEVERLRKDRELFEKRCVNLSKSTDEILEYLIPFVDNYLDDNDINRIIKWHNDNSNRH